MSQGSSPQKTGQIDRLKTPTRRFKNWWYRDLSHSSFTLLGMTFVAVAANALLWFGVRIALPQVQDLFASRTLSGALRAVIALLGQPIDLILLGAALLIMNLILIEWAALSLTRRIFGADQMTTRPMNFSRIAGLVLTAVIALCILLGIGLIGGGLAYGASRWYFGAVLPIILVTFLVFCLFLSWFMFLPFVIVKNGTTGPRALSESRMRARQVRGRLMTLIILLFAALLILLFGLKDLTQLVRIGLGLLIVPLGLSLLSTLYAESETKKIG